MDVSTEELHCFSSNAVICGGAKVKPLMLGLLS